MAFRSGFWNALPDANGDPFPKYNGDDFDRIGSLLVGNGVVRDGDALKVNQGANNDASYSLKVNAGVGFINGKWFYNSTEDNTTLVNIPSPDDNKKRYDLVVVRRCNNTVGENNRSFILKVIQGNQTTGNLTEPKLIQETDEHSEDFDICLARVKLSKVGGKLTIDIKDMRTFINGYWGEDFQKHMNNYEGRFNSTMSRLQQSADAWSNNTSLTQGIVYKRNLTLGSASKSVAVEIPEYQYGVDTLEVYTNGQKEYEGTDYTVSSDRTVTFTETKAAGVEILFEVTKYVDGTTDVTNAYTEISNTNSKVTEIETFLFKEASGLSDREVSSTGYNYICNGKTDNIAVSDIANAFLKEGTSEVSMLKINIYGTFGMTAAYDGTGEANNAWKWFNFANTSVSERKVILDFSSCSQVIFPIASGTNNILFYTRGSDVTLIGLNFKADQVGDNTTIQGVYATDEVAMENCRGWIKSYNDLIFATRGRYSNCRIFCESSNGTCVVFSPSGTDFVNVDGGIYWARKLSTSSGAYSTVVYHATDAANAVTIMNGVRMPTYSGGGQTNATRINNGYVSMINCVTALSNTTAAAATVSNVGTIPVSR